MALTAHLDTVLAPRNAEDIKVTADGKLLGPGVADNGAGLAAFYTPVATRFRSYGVQLSDYGDQGAAGAYADRLLNTPEFLEWERGALEDVRP